MSNLNDFKVEELEQRLEMGKWSGSIKGSSKDGGSVSGEIKSEF